MMLSDKNYIKALLLKSTTTGLLFTLGNKYLNGLQFSDGACYRGFIGSFSSAAVSELIMSSVVQRLLTMISPDNKGITRIFDSGSNAAISAILNSYAYKKLVSEAPNVNGNVFTSGEELYLQFAADALAELLSYYLVPFWGLSGSGVQQIYA